MARGAGPRNDTDDHGKRIGESGRTRTKAMWYSCSAQRYSLRGCEVEDLLFGVGWWLVGGELGDADDAAAGVLVD